MKVIIFGTGQFYRDYSSIIYKHEEVVGLLDNNPDKWGKVLDGVRIYDPNNFTDIEYNKIILLSFHGVEMHRQLVAAGISGEKLLYWNEYYSQLNTGECRLINRNHLQSFQKKILIVTTELNYNGGSLAAVYLATALRNKGYDAVLAAPRASEKLLDEYQELSFMIRPELPYVEADYLSWMEPFDMVIVNVLQMIQCACEMSRRKKTIWWIHESGTKYDSIYPDTMYQFPKYAEGHYFDKISIVAVSCIARTNFQQYFPNHNVEILTYGIPDENDNDNICVKQHDKTIFAVIGIVTERKGQDIFIEAADKLPSSVAEYWIIGGNGGGEYSHNVKEMALGNPEIKFLGEMTRAQIRKLYKEIDVVVCSSREETMSITITEGMMYGKTCIVSDHAGMAEYVDDGINGFTFKSEDSRELSAKMKWCVENKSMLSDIGERGRKTYEEYFSMEKFGERLEKIVLDE